MKNIDILEGILATALLGADRPLTNEEIHCKISKAGLASVYSTEDIDNCLNSDADNGLWTRKFISVLGNITVFNATQTDESLESVVSVVDTGLIISLGANCLVWKKIKQLTNDIDASLKMASHVDPIITSSKIKYTTGLIATLADWHAVSQINEVERHG